MLTAEDKQMGMLLEEMAAAHQELERKIQEIGDISIPYVYKE